MVNQADSQHAFLNELHDLVNEEADAQRLALNKLYHLPLAQRLAKGRALEGVTLELHEDGNIRARFGYNPSVFRQGDLVQIGRGDPLLDERFQASIEQEFEHSFILSIFHCSVDLHAENVEGWIIEDSYQDLSDWYRGALNATGETTIGRERILPLLMGETTPIIDPERYDTAMTIAETAGLNWSQSQAMAEAYACDTAYLIQGPPGTGKTRVLAQLAAQLARDGERVLVTSFTHRAINQALNTIIAHHPGTMALKIGRKSASDDLRCQNFENFADCPFRRSGSGYIVGATCFATQTNRLRDVQFDTIIFDEASQITLPLAVMGMLAARRYIFVGDQKQLPPVLTCRNGFNRPEDSVFGHLSGRGFETMLNISYRLSAPLCAWPSRRFYDDLLEPADKTEVTLSSALEFIVVEHEGNTVVAQPEIDAVVEIVSQLVQQGCPPHEIGIVAPFRAQGRAIRRRLLKLDRAFAPIVADTVERMQGQERDYILFSLVSSDCGFLENIAGFYFQPERLNVSITRARKKLFIIGSTAALRLEPEREPMTTWHNLFTSYLEELPRG